MNAKRSVERVGVHTQIYAIPSIFDILSVGLSSKSFSSESVCECSRFEHVPVFPWDDGELLLFISSSLCGGELLSF